MIFSGVLGHQQYGHYAVRLAPSSAILTGPHKSGYGPCMKKRKRDQILIEVFVMMGSASSLAKKLGVTRAAVSHWEHVPFRHLKEVSKLTGIPRPKLRPDIYEDT
jgi:hypothetical protein